MIIGPILLLPGLETILSTIKAMNDGGLCEIEMPRFRRGSQMRKVSRKVSASGATSTPFGEPHTTIIRYPSWEDRYGT